MSTDQCKGGGGSAAPQTQGTGAVVNGDAFGRSCDVEILEVGPGKARARMTLTPDHCNGLGMVHGGAIFTLADCAFAAACNSHGFPAVAINASISYVRAPQGAELHAEAQEVCLEGKLGSCLVRIMDEDGSIVATFQGLSYRKYQPNAKG